KGRTVVAIYYGHPGVFVLSTHRAVEIARREGHRAEMRPGVSALDCLCADLGIDPCYPGMQTFEATDMLLRAREPDITTHVVLWQVGVVAEMGYRRKGFLNNGFPILVEYLERFYGPDHPLTHYIASRYPTIPPTIERYTVAELLDPRVRGRINGISTFYIPPREGRLTDIDMAVRLGLAEPGQKPARAPTVRAIALYGKREMDAVDGLAGFRVPVDYQYQRPTRAAQFIVALTHDGELRRRFETDPEGAVAQFGGLSPWEARLLASRDGGRMQVAAKGMVVSHSPDEQLVVDILSRPEVARGFLAALEMVEGRRGAERGVNEWLARQGYQATLAGFGPAVEAVVASMLLPWTGSYASDGGVTVTIAGDARNNLASVVEVDGSRLSRFTFNHGTLAWDAGGGNPDSHGVLTFRMPGPDAEGAGRARTVSGRYWSAGQPEPQADNFAALEVPTADQDAAWGPHPALSALSRWNRGAVVAAA
ncbi:MAG: hypothetical protein JO306_10375, partial [Gemmatimonadetes bacterium]|nr:hypothetical protein [Gemmatimonadota bacterium]